MRTIKEEIILYYLYGLYTLEHINVLEDYMAIRDHYKGYKDIVEKYANEIKKALK